MAEAERLSIRTGHAEFVGVLLPFGLEVERLRIEGEQIELTREPFGVELAQPAKLEATVSDLGLQAFLERKKPGGLRDFFVQLTQGEIHVHATARVLIEVRAVAILTLEIVDKRQLFVRLKKVDVLGVGARGLVQKQFDEINPVLDVNDVPGLAELQKVEVGNGTIVLRATLLPKKD